MKAKEFLQQLQKLDRMIENKHIEIEQWKAMALSSTPSSESVLVKVKGRYELQNMEKVQSSSSSQQKMADAIDRYLDIEAEINLCIDKLIDTKKDVIGVIEQLNPIEYNLIHKIYVQYLTFKEAADKCDMSYSNATTIHGRALKHIQNILDKREKHIIL